MTFGDQAARGVHDILPTISNTTTSNQFMGFALLTQAESINHAHFIGAKAVMNFNNADIVGGDTRLLHRLLTGEHGHLISDEINGRAAEEVRRISGELLACDQDGLRLKMRPLVEEFLRNHNHGGAPVRGRATLEFRQGGVDHRRLHNLFQGVFILELGVWVSLAVLMVDPGNLCEILGFCAVLLHVLATGVAEELSGAGRVGNSASGFHQGVAGSGGVLAVVEIGLETAGGHLLEANDEDTVGSAVSDGLSGHIETGAAGRAVVVDVVDGNLSHAKLVEDTLAAGRVTIAVAGDALVDVVVVDLGVEHGFDTCLIAKFRVVDFATGLDEFGHAHA